VAELEVDALPAAWVAAQICLRCGTPPERAALDSCRRESGWWCIPTSQVVRWFRCRGAR
jgi:hypothetical protein